ncbi:ABC transporter permease [Puteibacter caeruleilacunae]|nr:ABC transporter permease [Puteibacter caeruleilacunae]
MIKNLILSAWASLKRKKTASLFTILTITLGMTMIVLIASIFHSYTGDIGPYKMRSKSLYIANLTFERNGEQVMRYRSKDASITFLKKTMMEMEMPALVGLYGVRHPENIGPRYNPLNVTYLETDANFWKIHQFKFVDGRPFKASEIENKERVCIISQKVAKHFFGKKKVAGKTIQKEDREPYRIVGVIENSHPHFEVSADYYLPYTLSVWDESSNYKSRDGELHYYNRGKYKGILVAKSQRDKSKIQAEYNRLIQRWNATGEVEEFEKVNSKLLGSSRLITASIGFGNDEPALIISFFMALIFIFLPVIILSNVNLYALRERLEEIGIRKSFGARRTDIIQQFIVENILITGIGCLFAIILGYFTNKALGQIIYQSYDIPGMQLNVSLILYLIIGIIIFGMLSIVLPVMRISRVHPVVAIQQHTAASSNQFQFKARKKWLQVATYFLLFIALINCSAMISIFYDNLSGVGYNTKHILILMVDEQGSGPHHDDEYNATKFKGFKERLLQIEGVEQVSYVLENPPLYIVPQFQNYTINDKERKARTLETDSVFCDLLSIRPVKGRLFKKESDKGGYIPAITTLAGEKHLFNGDALGKIVRRETDGRKVKIVGVIESYKNHPMGHEFKGLIVCRNRPSRSAVLKYHPDTDIQKLNRQIKEAVSNWPTGKMWLSQNENIEIEYNDANKRSQSMFYAALLATAFLLLNAFMGYLTLIYYNVRTRKKELGVRRATGANKISIIQKIIKENLSLMIIGSSIATILLWQFFSVTKIDKWEDFFHGLYLSTVVGLLMTIISALIPAIHAAKVQPVDALAEE